MMRPKHPDFTTEAQRHKDEREVQATGYSRKKAKNLKALRSFLWAASTDRPDHWASVAFSVVSSDSTKNESQRHKGTNMSFILLINPHIDDRNLCGFVPLWF